MVDDLMGYLNVAIKNERLLRLKMNEFVEKSEFEKKEDVYERIRELFELPL